MDISCIISSGDLELYVLGMLSQEDNLKVVQLADLFPEIRREIDEIQQSLTQLGDESGEENVPSASVRDELFARLHALREQRSKVIPFSQESSINTESFSDGRAQSDGVAVSQNKRTLNGLMLAASFIGLIICIPIIVYLSHNNTQYQQTASNLQSQLNQLQQTQSSQQQQLLSYQNSLLMYQDSSYRRINLTSVPGRPNMLVQLFWNKNTHDVYVADVSLPKAPAGKQYQLWALIDGKPVNAGVISEHNIPQQMVQFARADAFAITLEKQGGSPTPTLSEMYVMGKT